MALFNEILGVHKKFKVCSEQRLANGTSSDVDILKLFKWKVLSSDCQIS